METPACCECYCECDKVKTVNTQDIPNATLAVGLRFCHACLFLPVLFRGKMFKALEDAEEVDGVAEATGLRDGCELSGGVVQHLLGPVKSDARQETSRALSELRLKCLIQTCLRECCGCD